MSSEADQQAVRRAVAHLANWVADSLARRGPGDLTPLEVRFAVAWFAALSVVGTHWSDVREPAAAARHQLSQVLAGLWRTAIADSFGAKPSAMALRALRYAQSHPDEMPIPADTCSTLIEANTAAILQTMTSEERVAQRAALLSLIAAGRFSTLATDLDLWSTLACADIEAAACLGENSPIEAIAESYAPLLDKALFAYVRQRNVEPLIPLLRASVLADGVGHDRIHPAAQFIARHCFANAGLATDYVANHLAPDKLAAEVFEREVAFRNSASGGLALLDYLNMTGRP